MRLWLKPCPRCRAGQLLELQNGSLSRITCVACAHVLTFAERRALIEGMLEGRHQQLARTAA